MGGDGAVMVGLGGEEGEWCGGRGKWVKWTVLGGDGVGNGAEVQGGK